MTRWILAVCLLLCSRPASAAEYQDGHLYLLKYPYEGSISILHIDPISGDVNVQAPLGGPPYWSTMTYDPYRDVMVVSLTSNLHGGLNFVAADGTRTSLPSVITPFTTAPRGDGIIYLIRNNEIYRYLDANDVEHDLLDANGDPFGLGSLGTFWDEAYYHAETNSLLLANGDDAGTAEWCPAGDQTCIVRLPLDSTGTRVVGPIVSSQIDIIPGISEDNVVGISPGPNGLLCVVVDTNSNSQEPRMQLFDPVNLTWSTWASNGFYIGAAATHAGVYSTVRGDVVIYDSGNDRLRTFAFNEVGSGTLFGPSLGSGFASLSARLREVQKESSVGVAPVASALDPVAVSPNPSRGRTTVSFSTPVGESARVSVFDVAGRKIQSYESLDLGGGAHSMVWDGRDSRGASVVPGVYFVRVYSGMTVRSVKVARVR